MGQIKSLSITRKKETRAKISIVAKEDNECERILSCNFSIYLSPNKY